MFNLTLYKGLCDNNWFICSTWINIQCDFVTDSMYLDVGYCVFHSPMLKILNHLSYVSHFFLLCIDLTLDRSILR